MIPRIYKTDKNGLTVDGYCLGSTPRIMPDIFRHPDPLPCLGKNRVASFDEKHAEEMRKAYGEEDGDKISWATKLESPEPDVPQPLTAEDVTRLHGEETMRRLCKE